MTDLLGHYARLYDLLETPRERAQLHADCVLEAVPCAPTPPTCDCTACHYGAGTCEDIMRIPDHQPPTTIGGVAERLFSSPLGDELCAAAEKAAAYHVSVVLGAAVGDIHPAALREHPELGDLALRVTEADERCVLVVRRLW